MSFQAMTWAVKQRGISPTQKLLLLMLANYAGEDGSCWPSKQRLADDCCLSKAGVCKVLNELVEAGLISVEERRREDGLHSSSVIRLIAKGVVHEVDYSVRRTVHDVDRGSPPRGQGVVHEVDTNLSLEPINEPRGGSPSAPPPQRKGTRINEGFEPNETCIELAVSLGIPDLEEVTEQFIDHWSAKAGKDGVKLDWQAAFRTWLRNEVKFNRRNGHEQRHTIQRETPEERRSREIYERHLVRR